jgi:DNA-binding transcriptional LysR family regulator
MALVEHLEKLRHFHKIAQHNSINETAQKTGLSQAGLSKSLLLLEEVLGCKLFIRSREGLTLTKEGEEVLNVSRSIIQQASDLEGRLRSLLASKAPETLKIGMYDSIAIYFGIELHDYLQNIYPQVKLILHADTSSQLLKKINDDELDLIIGVNYHKLQNKSVTHFQLFEDYYSQYISAKENQKNQNNKSYILHQNATDENGIKLTEILSQDLKSKAIHTVQNFETLKQLVINGFGIGILPSLVAKPILAQNLILPLKQSKSKNQFGKHTIGVLVRNDILKKYEEFTKDIIRLGDRWIKT